MAGSPAFATGGMGGTGVNAGSNCSLGMGTDYSLLLNVVVVKVDR